MGHCLGKGDCAHGGGISVWVELGAPALQKAGGNMYWKGKWKIPGHFQVYLILPTGPGSGRFVGLLIDKENEVQRENIANFRSWALKKNFLNEIKLIYFPWLRWVFLLYSGFL